MVSRATTAEVGLRISALSARERRWLGAIAVEHILGRSVLAMLRDPGKAPLRAAGPQGEPQLEAWLTASVASGLLVKVAPSVTAAASRDTEAYRLRDHEQLVLRELRASDQLDAIALETQALLGARSIAELTVALQHGDLDRFSRRLILRKNARLLGMRNAAEWLRATVCEPFDPGWLERTFGDRAVEVASRVLGESLRGPKACHALRSWMGGRLAEVESAELRGAVESSLREHALLRGEPALPADVASVLPRSTTFGYEAAARFVSGDLPAAQQCLDRALGGGGARSALPQCGAVAPILALMLLARDDPGAAATAKRLVTAATSDAGRGAARALRRLLQYLGRPAARLRRIRPRDLAPDAGAWEVLLSAFTAHLHFDDSAIRAGWSQRLVQEALEWRSAGYEWWSTQGLLLASDLSAEYCRRELVEQGADTALLQPHTRQLSLWDLIAPKPEWKRTLEALAEVAASVAPSSDGGQRVAWFVDMSDGSLGRPALQEHRPAAGGWSQGKRMSIAELHQHREGLPAEDVRVLACTRETVDGHRELTADAYEMLIGHPRVLDGMRGHAPVEVARGTCRVETEEEGGYLRVLVEPEGAALGINVVPETDSRLVVYRVTEAMHRVIEVLPRGVRVPTAHAAEVLRVLSSLAQSVEVRSAQLGVERTVEPDSTACLRIAPHAGAWQVQAGVRPFGDKGRLFVAGSGRSSVTLSSDGLRLRCDRRFDLERARIEAVIAACPTLQRDPEDEATAPALGDEPDSWYLGLDGVLGLLAELRDSQLCATSTTSTLQRQLHFPIVLC